MPKKLKCKAINFDKTRCNYIAILKGHCMIHFLRDNYKVIKKNKEKVTSHRYF